MEHKCLYCYEETAGEAFHKVCAKAFFSTTKPPILAYSLESIKDLAKTAIARSLSVTGVQEKISLAITKSQQENRLTIGGIWGNYILKPPSASFPEMPLVEHLCMKLADAGGLVSVPHTLCRLASGELAYLTRRIDRTDSGQKIHMEDMCQLTGRLTEDKYHSSMEQIAKAIRLYSDMIGLDLVRFYEQTVFSFLTGNADMHLKNFSLYYPNGKVQLAPAYDMVATRLLLSEKEDPEELALTLNGKKRKFKAVDFLTFGQRIGLREKQIQNIHASFEASLPRWKYLIKKSFLSQEMQGQFEELIQKRLQRLQA